MQTMDQRVVHVVGGHPAVRGVELVGSRAEGRASDRSDWDFLVWTASFASHAEDLPVLCAPLDPIAQQWDRLSCRFCWMLILAGPTKIDLIFPNQPHRPEPPWEASRENLEAMDTHFWDWTLWLGSKSAAGHDDLIAAELEKLHRHLLSSLGVEQVPPSVAAAVIAYRQARADAERRFGLRVSRDLERVVTQSAAF